MNLDQIKYILKTYRTYLWLYRTSGKYYYYNQIMFIKRNFIDDLRHYLWFDDDLNHNTAFSWHKEIGDITKEFKYD